MTTAAQVLAVAKTQVGYVEGPKDNQNRYAAEVGHADRQPWCATSVVWVFKRAGGLALLPSTSAYTPTMYQGFKNAGQAVTGSMRTALKPGDVVFFEWPGKGRIAHVGIFSHYDAKGAWCYEGNTNAAGSRTGGEFLLKHRKHGLITHAGRPKYEATAAPAAAPVTEKEDAMGLTAPDKKFLRDLFVLVLRGEDHTGKKTGHPNLEDLTAKVAALQADVDALQADHVKHTEVSTMDRIGARNAFVVLLTVVGLTVMSVAALLWLIIDNPGTEPPAVLLGIVTTFVGFLTGTQVSFDAKPRVDAAQRAAESMATDLRIAAEDTTRATLAAVAVPTVTTLSTELVGGLESFEESDDSLPAVDTDADEEDLSSV